MSQNGIEISSMIIPLVSGLLQDIDSRLRKIESQQTAASATADICADEIFDKPLQTAEGIIELDKEPS